MNESINWQEFYVRATKSIILFLNLFTNLDLPGGRRIDRKNLTRAISVAIYVCYLYCNVRMLVTVWFTYKYSFSVYNYEQYLKATLANQGARCGMMSSIHCLLNVTLINEEHLERIRQARASVKKVGSPWLEFAFAWELLHLFLLIVAFYVVNIPRWYFNRGDKIKSELLCLILNEDEGRRRVEQMVATVTQQLQDLCHKRSQPNSLHRSINYQLKALKAQGNLEPVNRRREVVLDVCTVFCHLCMIVGACQLTMGSFLLFGVNKFSMFSSYRLHTGFMDLLALSETATVLLMSLFGTALYLTMLGLNMRDQILTAKLFIRDFQTCVIANEESLSSWTLSRRRRQEEIGRRDRSLLDLIVKFKMFRQQTRATLPFNGFFVFAAGNLAAYGPILVYVNAIYIKTELIMVLFGLLVLVLTTVTLIWVPSCYMYSRCEDIYRALFSLRAHVVRLEESHRVVGYHPQLVELLHRELSHPEKLLDDFACQFSGVRFTYKDILRYQFFYGLALISAYFLHRNRDKGAAHSTSLLNLL